MEIDQVIFQKIYNFFTRQKQQNGLSICAVPLKNITAKLSILARAASGQAIDIQPSEREGGWQGNTFYLPQIANMFSSVDGNIRFYIFRICYLAVQKKLLANWPEASQHTVAESRIAAFQAAHAILPALFNEFPGLKKIHQQLRDALPVSEKEGAEADFSWLYGRFFRTVQIPIEGDHLRNINKQALKNFVEEMETVIEAQRADDVEIISVDKKAQEDYVMTHNFEKVDTVEEFDGVWRDFDGDDSLENDLDAIQQYNLKHLVRVDDPVHSLYQAEFSAGGTIAESITLNDDNFHYSYPEWDFSKRRYRAAHCKVFPQRLTTPNKDYFQRTITENRSLLLSLKKTFAQLNNKWEQVRRQTSGDTIDIDAVVDLFSDIKARRIPSEKLYFSKRKQAKELSLLLLLDLSLSSDAYANGNRILDVEKQISILFGEVLEEYGIDFQIDGFFSKTRNNTTYITLKAFNEPWDKARLRIGSAEATGYTRIGPALRHAASILEKSPHRKKWLLLLSDGKPNDYDRYEGRYGVEDIKQALREMRVKQINNFAFAIEEQAKYYLPQMFGENHYNILTSPVELLQALTKLYDRIEHS